MLRLRIQLIQGDVHRAPRSDQSIVLALDHVTTRGECAVFECRYAELKAEGGTVSITAKVTGEK